MPEVVGKEQVWKTSDGKVTKKESEVTGTWDMPIQSAPSKRNPNEKPRSIAMPPKVGSLQELFGWGEEEKVAAAAPTIDDELEAMFKEASPQQVELPQDEPEVKKVLTPHVDVSGMEAPAVLQQKTAQYYAMPSIRRYPIDGMHQIKAASQYFDENNGEMDPEDRREFAANLVKRASAVGMETSELAQHYGAPGYAPRAHVLTELAAREDLTKEAEHQGLYDEIKEHVGIMPPDLFARTLYEIDKHAGVDEYYGKGCMDPWYTTFGTPKTAAPSVADPKDAVVIGAEYMKVPDLLEFAQGKSKMIEARFGKDFTEEFQKDPVAIFDTLPRDQKIVVMRMVNNSPNSMQGASVS